jgi:methyl-galactoside transport system substrate-binding protein
LGSLKYFNVQSEEEQMKKALVLVLMAMMVFGIISCNKSGGSEGAKGGTITIGASIRKYDDTYLTEQRNNMQVKGNELGVTIDFTDSKADQVTQNNNIDIYITKKYNALAVNMQERSAADVVISKAKAANIPVVFFNTEPFAEAMALWDKVYYVGARAEESGLQQGWAMADYWEANKSAVDINEDGKLQIVILQGEPGHQDAELRTQYCQEALKERGVPFEVVAQNTAMWDRVKGQDVMATFLASTPTIEAVFANNDDMALGAIEALKAKGYFQGGKYMPVMGVDATEAGKGAIADGTMLATALNDAKNQGYAVVQLCNILAKGEALTDASLGYKLDGRYVWIPYIAVNKANLSEFK